MAALLDAAVLRAKYGEPLPQETFQVRPNIEIVVNYGPDRQVGSIEFPASAVRQEVDEIIDELVPPSWRGEEIGRKLWIFGGYSMSSLLYEHVTIAAPLESDQSSLGLGVTITFH
jgi:hypothetical protein